MENPFKHIVAGVAAASLASSAPVEQAPTQPTESSLATDPTLDEAIKMVEQSPEDNQVSEGISLEEQAKVGGSQYTNGQYTKEEIEKILSGTTEEVDGMTSEEIERLQAE
jgi:aconitase B